VDDLLCLVDNLAIFGLSSKAKREPECVSQAVDRQVSGLNAKEAADRSERSSYVFRRSGSQSISHRKVGSDADAPPEQAIQLSVGPSWVQATRAIPPTERGENLELLGRRAIVSPDQEMFPSCSESGLSGDVHVGRI